MTREHKLALIIGFALVLIVGILVSDHFSNARTSRLEDDMASNMKDYGEGGVLDAPEPLIAPLPFAVEMRPKAPPESPAVRPLDDMNRMIVMGEELDPVNPIERDLRNTPAIKLRNESTSDPILDLSRADEKPTVLRDPLIDSSAPTRQHTVRKDDTMWSLAARYYGEGSLHQALTRFNSSALGKGGTLVVGSTLDIPPRDKLLDGSARRVESSRRSNPVSFKTKPSSGKPEAARVYEVKKGDIGGEIATRLLGSSLRWNEIVEFNDLDDPDDIRPGMKLKIPGR